MVAVGRRGTAAAIIVAAQAALVAIPAHGAAIPVVTGTTVLSGSRNGSIAVRLPRAVRFDVYQHVEIAAHGRLTGFALKKDGAWDAPSAHAIKSGFCGSPGCTPVWPRSHVGMLVSPDSTGFSGTLPAGTYRLFLLTDGAPVRVTLQFAGLRGRSSLTPRSPVRAAVVAPKPTIAEPTWAPLVFAGGSHWHVGPRGGLNLTVAWKVQPAPEEPSAVGACLYSGRPPAGAVPPFQAPCANGSGGLPPYVARNHADGSAPPTALGPGRYISFIEAGGVYSPGSFSQGAYHNTAGPVTSAHLHQVWLDF